MVKVSVFYPNKPGARFDMDYYLTKHIPMVVSTLGAALKGASVDQGLSTKPPFASAAYLAMGHLLFESEAAFRQAFDPHGREIMADVPNFTDIEPILQLSEVRQ